MNALMVPRNAEDEIEEGRKNGQMVQIYAGGLPQPARQRMERNLAVLPGYRWASQAEKREALAALDAAKDAHDLGFRNQVIHQLVRAEDKFLFDASRKSVVLARRAGLELRPLAKLSREPGKRFEIEGAPMNGQRIRWRFCTIEEFQGAMPAEVLRNARKLKEAGLGWDQAYVGEPYVIVRRVIEESGTPAPASRKSRDPVLAFSEGRWLLEVGRWL